MRQTNRKQSKKKSSETDEWEVKEKQDMTELEKEGKITRERSSRMKRKEKRREGKM